MRKVTSLHQFQVNPDLVVILVDVFAGDNVLTVERLDQTAFIHNALPFSLALRRVLEYIKMVRICFALTFINRSECTFANFFYDLIISVGFFLFDLTSYLADQLLNLFERP